MTKIRIYELARELDVDSKKVIEIAMELGFAVKNHMSNLEQNQAKQIRNRLKPPQPQPQAKPQQKKQPKPKARAGAQNTGITGVKARRRSREKEQLGPVKLEARSYTVAELEPLFGIPAAKLIQNLISLGVMANINQPLDTDTVEILAAQVGVECLIAAAPVQQQQGPDLRSADGEDAVERPPVVTVMGHVDHGKTSLLDAIRQANVTASEAGGITQHIGAYQVEKQGKKITFIDTPGHEAFTAMRARGARVTDVAILVVAADEGVKPQTVEALNHAKAAGVPIIVALNKMDKANANPDRVKQQLAQHNLVSEDWGGDTIFVEVSALTGQGLDQLLEMILLVAEMEELKAPVDKLAQGTIIESQLDKGRGPVATVLVQQGTLKVGDPLVCGPTYGKVRAMFNDRGQRLDSAGPSVPVEILGLSDVPPAGAIFQVVADERKARAKAQSHQNREKLAAQAPKTRVSLDEVFKQMEKHKVSGLNLLLKSDVQGTNEAIKQSLAKIEVKDVAVNVIHDGVGAITSSDVMLASASDAIIIGFNVRPDSQAQRLAEEEKVEIRLYRIIYELLDDVRAALEGMLEPEYVEEVIGRAEVRNTFRHSRLGTIAGCYVQDGKITNHAFARLLRDGVIVYEGKISSLKRFKEDVKEVSSGYECGMMLENFNDIKEGDNIEAYVMVEKK